MGGRGPNIGHDMNEWMWHEAERVELNTFERTTVLLLCDLVTVNPPVTVYYVSRLVIQLIHPFPSSHSSESWLITLD